MTEPGFAEYLDDLILAMAEAQTDHSVVNQDIYEFHHMVRPQAPTTWSQLAPKEMERLGWVRLPYRAQPSKAQILGPGIKRAQEVRQARRPRSIRERLGAVPRSDWIAILALIVSAIALWKD